MMDLGDCKHGFTADFCQACAIERLQEQVASLVKENERLNRDWPLYARLMEQDWQEYDRLNGDLPTRPDYPDDLRVIANGLLADGLDVSQLTKTGRDELRQALDRLLVLSGYANELVSKAQCEDLMRQAVAAEREACAQVAENWYKSAGNHVGTLIAAAIRGREDGA